MSHRVVIDRGRLVALATLFAMGLLISGDNPLQPHSASGTDPAHTRPLSVSRLLWPGAFVSPAVNSGRASQFEASGRRYVAAARSDGFLVRRELRTQQAVDVRFVEAAQGVAPELSGEIPGSWTFLKGSGGGTGAERWRRFTTATFREVYPGIAARYRANEGDLELDFLLAPGADPGSIQLAGQQGTQFAVDRSSGDVLVTRGHEHFRLHRPRAFQPQMSGYREVAVEAIAAPDLLRFRVPQYDSGKPLIIDPLMATWSTFLGTDTDAMSDDTIALATDSSGDLYVAGLTELDTGEIATDSFPTTPQSLDPANPRSPGDNCAYQCGYVLKLTPTHQVIYGALIYGLTVNALAVDSAGSAYITGSTLDGTNFPGTSGVFDNDPSGEAFVSKISADGSSFVYSALFPADMGNGIAVDVQGNAYVVGQVSSSNLPTTPGSLKPTNPQGATINQDGFLLKINPAGSALVYGTYLGGSATDVANAVQVDAAGEAIVVGQTASSDFVGLSAKVVGPSDAFLIKVASDGSRIVSGQTFGGSGDDVASGLASDGTGGWITCGNTTSSDLPTTGAALQSRLLGETNGWVRRVDSNFNTLYATYFGGSFTDGCLNVASDAQGNAYLVGVSFSADLPVTPTAFQDTTSAVTNDYFAGLSNYYITSQTPDREAYFAQLSATGSLLYSTYLGGFETSPRDYSPLTIGQGVTVASSGLVSVSGATEAASFPVTDNGLRNGLGGQADGFIVSFAASPLSITTASLLPAAAVQGTYNVTLAASGGTPPYTWSKVGFELPTGLMLSPGGVISGTANNTQTESTGYQFTVKVTDGAGQVGYKSFFINVAYPGNLVCSGSVCSLTIPVTGQIAYQIPPLARGVSPQSFSTTGQWPPGITVSNTGEISGAATKTGAYIFGVIVTDAVGNSAPLTFHMQVTGAGGGQPAVVVTATPSSVSIGQSFTLQWRSTAVIGDCTASGGGANGQPWAGAMAQNGSATQSATTAGTFTYTLTCPANPGPTVGQAVVTVTGSGSGSSGNSGASGGGGGGMTGFEIGLLTLLLAMRPPHRRRSAALRL